MAMFTRVYPHLLFLFQGFLLVLIGTPWSGARSRCCPLPVVGGLEFQNGGRMQARRKFVQITMYAYRYVYTYIYMLIRCVKGAQMHIFAHKSRDESLSYHQQK